MRNIIDRIIGYVNPHAGIARHSARRQLQQRIRGVAFEG